MLYFHDLHNGTTTEHESLTELAMYLCHEEIDKDIVARYNPTGMSRATVLTAIPHKTESGKVVTIERNEVLLRYMVTDTSGRVLPLDAIAYALDVCRSNSKKKESKESEPELLSESAVATGIALLPVETHVSWKSTEKRARQWRGAPKHQIGRRDTFLRNARKMEHEKALCVPDWASRMNRTIVHTS